MQIQKFDPNYYYTGHIDNEVVTVDSIPVTMIRTLNSFWHGGWYEPGCQNKLQMEGAVTIINPDSSAQIAAVQTRVRIPLNFPLRGDRYLADDAVLRTFIFPRKKGDLTEDANGAFRAVMDEQMPSAFLKAAIKDGVNPTSLLIWGHKEAMQELGIETNEYGAYLCDFNPRRLVDDRPVRELCKAPASSHDPQKRLATCSVLASILKRSMQGLITRPARELLLTEGQFFPAQDLSGGPQ